MMLDFRRASFPLWASLSFMLFSFIDFFLFSHCSKIYSGFANEFSDERTSLILSLFNERKDRSLCGCQIHDDVFLSNSFYFGCVFNTMGLLTYFLLFNKDWRWFLLAAMLSKLPFSDLLRRGNGLIWKWFLCSQSRVICLPSWMDLIVSCLIFYY